MAWVDQRELTGTTFTPSLRTPQPQSSSSSSDPLSALLAQLTSDPSALAALEGMGGLDGEEGEEGVGNVLDGMMRQLMTKEILMEPLEELADKVGSRGVMARMITLNANTIGKHDRDGPGSTLPTSPPNAQIQPSPPRNSLPTLNNPKSSPRSSNSSVPPGTRTRMRARGKRFIR
jgi:hypothetical protein